MRSWTHLLKKAFVHFMNKQNTVGRYKHTRAQRGKSRKPWGQMFLHYKSGPLQSYLVFEGGNARGTCSWTWGQNGGPEAKGREKGGLGAKFIFKDKGLKRNLLPTDKISLSGSEPKCRQKCFLCGHFLSSSLKCDKSLPLWPGSTCIWSLNDK